MLQQLIGSVRELKWSNAALELVVVALGILMAFQVDRWWESRDDRLKEQEYVGRLIVDLEEDVEALTFAIDQANLRLSFARLLMDVAENSQVALAHSVEFIIAVNQAAFTFTPPLASSTFEELRSTGNLGLLLNTELRNTLFEYYQYDENQRQYLPLNFMQEFRHFELGAGILTNVMLRKAHVDWRIVSSDELAQFRNDVVDDAGLVPLDVVGVRSARGG